MTSGPSTHTVPRLLLWLVQRFCHEAVQEEFLGDLEELHEVRAGQRLAGLRIWFDGLSLLRVHFRRQRSSSPLILSVSMLRNYFLVALRSIRRHAVMTSINLVGMSLAMAVTLILVLFVRQAEIRDEFHDNGDRIVRVYSDFKSSSNRNNALYGTSPASLAGIMQTDVSGVENVVRLRRGFHGILQYGDTGLPMNGYWADPGFLEVFSFELQSGDPRTALSEPGAIVISPSEAERFFGSEDALGQTMSVVGDREYTVTGVLARDDYPTMFPLTVLASYSSLESDPEQASSLDQWYASIYRSYTFALLEKGTSLASVQQQVRSLIPVQFPEYENNKLHDLIVQPLEDISLGTAMGNELGANLPGLAAWFLLSLAAIILLTACFNYVGLTVSRALKRSREVGVRKVFGAARTHITTQFLFETIVISGIGVGIALVLLQWLTPAFNSLTFVAMSGLSLDIDWMGDPGLYLVLFVFTGVVALIAGAYPALFLSRFRPAAAVKGMAGLSGGNGSRLRKSLVVVQFSVSLILLVVAVVMVRQARFMQQSDYGFNAEHVVNVRLSDVPYERFRDRVSQGANVESVSGISIIPATGSRSDVWISVPGASDDDTIKGYRYAIDANLIDNLELSLVAGSNVSDVTPFSDSRQVVVNEVLLDQLQLGSPVEAIGKTFILGDTSRVEIAGVLKDFHADDLSSEIDPYVFFYQPEMIRWANVRLVPERFEAGMQDIRDAWLAMGQSQAIDMEIFEVQLAENFINQAIRDMYRLVGFVAFLAVVIACLGLLGIALFNVESRTREISIRKVLGADTRTLVTLLSKEFLVLIGIATVLALPIAWLLANQWLQMFAYRVNAGPGTLALSLALLLTITFAAIGSQTIKAALANPINHLHDD